MNSGSLLGLIPLIAAGFLFNIIFYRFRVHTAAADGQRLFLLSCCSGVVIAFFSWPLARYLELDTYDWFKSYPNNVNVSGFVVAFGLAVILGLVCNGVEKLWLVAFGDKSGPLEYRIRRHIEAYGDEQQKLLVRALESSPKKLVFLSLSSRKIYCGVVLKVHPISRLEDRFVELLPLFSATREKDTLKLIERLDYPAFRVWAINERLAALQELCEKPAVQQLPEFEGLKQEITDLRTTLDVAAKGLGHDSIASFDVQDWVKVVRLSDVETMSCWDELAYDYWIRSSERGDHKPSANPSDSDHRS